MQTKTMATNAHAFFEACETGKGWEACEAYCHKGATFSCQADALAEVTTLAAYADWMKGLLTPVPDGNYVVHGFGVDDERNTVVVAASFRGTHTGEGGPVAATGNSVNSDYVYTMVFKGDKITHMTKTWNDQQALRQLGWG